MIETPDVGNRNRKLFFCLEKLMKEEAPYLDPDLTRRQVAEMLATNENYLYQALHYALPNERFMDYINRYRLEYAVRLLLEVPEAKIEVVALCSGFRVRQTFYRNFQAHYGVTPIKYRESKIRIQRE